MTSLLLTDLCIHLFAYLFIKVYLFMATSMAERFVARVCVLLLLGLGVLIPPEYRLLSLPTVVCLTECD